MATQKSIQTAPAESVNDSPEIVSSADRAIEPLLAEIVSTAYITGQHLRHTPGDVPALHEYHADMLRDIVARMGWMADIALKRLGSNNCMYEGDAAAWLMSPRLGDLLAPKAQS